MKFVSWIKIPAVKGEFELTKEFDDKTQAMHWLAQQVGRNPESERYGVYNDETGEEIHKSGAMP
jgi:hypothetical protein